MKKKNVNRRTRLVIGVIGIVGLVALVVVSAAATFVAIEAESGTWSGPTSSVSDSGASGGEAIRFGASQPQGGNADRFGVKWLYPSLPGGKNWVSKWDNGRYRTITGVRQADPDDEWSRFRGEGSLKIDGNGMLMMSGSQPRLYVYDPQRNDQWRDVEITMYFRRVSDNNTGYAGMVAVARTNHDENYGCDTRGIGARFRFDGSIDFYKEVEHSGGYPTVNNRRVLGWSSSTYNIWVGFKYVVYDLPDGSVKLENYIDTTDGSNGGHWVKVNEFVDNGTNLGSGYQPCRSGINPALQLTNSPNRAGSESGKPNISVYFRGTGINNDGLQYKRGSIREIQAP